MIEGEIDTEAEALRESMSMVKIPAKMKSTGLFRYTLPWDEVGINVFKNKEHIRYSVIWLGFM